MHRSTAPIVAVAAAVVASLSLLGGCTGSTASTERSAARESTPADAAGSPSDAASSSSPPNEAPKPGSMDTPATSAGPLTQKAFPRPGRLGPQATYAVDPGDAEEGYAGNGTPALARDPEEVVLAAVPLGCPRPDLPVPDHALEVDYRVADAPVIAIRAEFADTETAARFFELRAGAIGDCAGRTDSSAVGVLVGRVEAGRRSLVSERTPDSDPWTEIALVDGRRVTLVAVGASMNQEPATPDGVRRIQTAFRG